ncbi:N-acetyltransferase [archaeon]|nr:MAG: N-acetyltransferase [archaeon]
MTSTTYILRSERLGFSLWNQQNKADFIRLYSNNEATTLIGGPFTTEQIEARFQTQATNYIDYKMQYFPLYLLDTLQLVGCCGLRPYNHERQIFELGFHFLPEHWKKGYASESSKAMINYAFDVLQVKELFAGHHPQNTASKQLLEKLGFLFVKEEYYEPTGLMHPSYTLTNKCT